MVMNTARRVREGLAELIRLANDPATPTSDLRVLLGECKTFGGQLTVLQADTAAGLAGRERHGDSGVGVLAQAVGLSRRDAAGQVKWPSNWSRCLRCATRWRVATSRLNKRQGFEDWYGRCATRWRVATSR